MNIDLLAVASPKLLQQAVRSSCCI